MDGAEAATDFLSQMMRGFKRLQFYDRHQIAFLEDFYTLINDGIPPNRAIDMMSQVTKGIVREVSQSISLKISEGQPLAEGMREWFNPNIIEIVRVGEEAGALNETIRSAIATLSQQTGILSAFVSAVSYPLFVIIIACGLIVYLNTSIFTQFRTIKPISQWPEAGRQLVDVAQLIESWWWAVLIVVILIIWAMRRVLKNYIGEFRSALDSFPPFSLYRRFCAARFLETLGLLVANGVVFKQALRVMQYQSSPYVGSHLVIMEHQLAMGRGNIADVLETGLIDEADILRLRVMAEVKGLEHGLIRMGKRGSEQLTLTMKIISRIMGGALLVIAGMLVIIIIRGIYLTGMSMGAA